MRGVVVPAWNWQSIDCPVHSSSTLSPVLPSSALLVPARCTSTTLLQAGGGWCTDERRFLFFHHAFRPWTTTTPTPLSPTAFIVDVFIYFLPRCFFIFTAFFLLARFTYKRCFIPRPLRFTTPFAYHRCCLTATLSFCRRANWPRALGSRFCFQGLGFDPRSGQ